MPTPDVAGLGRIRLHAEVVWGDEVQLDVPLDEQLGHVGVGHQVLGAALARQQHDGLGHTSAERIAGGQVQGVHGCLLTCFSCGDGQIADHL